jgi:hypothetical protein
MMYFANAAVVFLTCTLALVAAAPTRLLPIIKRAADDTPSTPSTYIVAFKPNTVDPANRAAWLDSTLTAANASLSDHEKSALRVGWSETIFNGLAGKFNTDALNVLRGHEDVEYIQESTSFSVAHLLYLGSIVRC